MVTETFQDGIAGYSGCQDSHISSWPYDPHVNSGDSSRLELRYYSNVEAMIKFDLTNLPQGLSVSSGKLELYLNNPPSNPRSVTMYKVLKPWKEYEVTYKSAQTGQDWAELGLKAGEDYAMFQDFSAFSLLDQEGWYEFDVTPLLEDWIDYPDQNCGVIIIDNNGYDGALNHSFHSSDYGDDYSLRPKLTITYNPDAPDAKAGDDYLDEHWPGGTLQLDGTASSDPSDDAKSLLYSWSIVSKPGKSNASEANFSPNNATGWSGADYPVFTPDVGGSYTIRLTVTNSIGETDTDEVLYRLLDLNETTHPRIYLTPERMATLTNLYNTSAPQWTRLREYLDGSSQYSASTLIRAYAVAYLIEGKTSDRDKAISYLMGIVNDGEITNLDNMGAVEGVAIGYDWLYHSLTSTQRTSIINWLNNQGDIFKGSYLNSWHNYSAGAMVGIGLTGLATLGDNDRAREWMDHARWTRWEYLIKPGFEVSGAGGGWPEGTAYGLNAIWRITKFIRAWADVTNEDLFDSVDFFKDRLDYTLFMHYPGIYNLYGNYYRDFIRLGDGIRGLKGYQNYLRAASLMLIDRFRDEPEAQVLNWYLSQAPADKMPNTWMYVEDFLWHDNSIPTIAPTDLSHLATGTGTVFMRSDWTQDATWASFQCGDHFEYHQHLDQNTFTIFRNDDLAIETGNYDGYGGSGHAINYHKRTIAHNGMLVYNPNEFFHSIVGGTDGDNDGGQRTMYPKSIQAGSASSWLSNTQYYETGDILYYMDDGETLYLLGDATNAYNSTDFTPDPENIPKLKHFTRQFVYIRPNVFIVFDRVGSADASFQKKWLLHFLNEPTITDGTYNYVSNGEYLYTNPQNNGMITTATAGTSRLYCQTLLPEAHQIRKVGLRGVKDYWVFGTNYPAPTGDEPHHGEWRIEVEPSVSQEDDVFLNVINVGDDGSTAPAEADLVMADENKAAGVLIDNKLYMFRTYLGTDGPFTYSLTGYKTVEHNLYDLEPEGLVIVTETSAAGTDIRNYAVNENGNLSFTSTLNGTHTFRIDVKSTKNLAIGLNYSFEDDGGTLIGMPVKWTESGAFGGDGIIEYSVVDDEVYSGDYAARIKVDGPAPTDDLTVAALVADSSVIFKAGHTYKFSAAIKREQSQSFRMILFRFGYTLQHIEYFDAADTGTSDSGWQIFSTYYTMPKYTGPEGEYFPRIDSIVRRARTDGSSSCSIWIDDIHIEDLGVEELESTYTPGGLGYGIRNRFFSMGTYTATSGDYTSYEMPLGWDITWAVDSPLNNAPGTPVWKQEIPALSLADGYAASLTARALDNSNPAWPSIGTVSRINPTDSGNRHILTFQYGSTSAMKPMLRAFLIDDNFNHISYEVINSNITYPPGEKMWPLSIHIVPEYDQTNLIIRFDNVTYDVTEIHTQETKAFIDNVELNTAP